MKISEIDEAAIIQYLKLDEPTPEDEKIISSILPAVMAYISEYTGLPIKSDKPDVETLDDHEEFWPVVMVIAQDMYDNRSLYVEKNSLNKMVTSILDMHCRNLL